MRSALFNIGFAMAMIGSVILIIVGALAALGIFLLIFYPVYAISALFWGDCNGCFRIIGRSGCPVL